MPKSDVRPNLKVSDFAKTQDFEICKLDGTLHPLNERCPLCNMKNSSPDVTESLEDVYTLFKRE